MPVGAQPPAPAREPNCNVFHMGVLDAFRLDDKVAIVTGGSRGIGQAVADAFAEMGATVVIAARDAAALDNAAVALRRHGGTVEAVSADLNDTDALTDLAHHTASTFGRIDIVVNNVGGSPPRPLLDTSIGMFERSFHFNVTTAFALTKAAAPVMLDGEGGAIINISSLIGRLSDRGFAAYGTAKGALTHLTRLLAADLSPRVRVNGIAVGSVATDALATVLTDDLRSQMEQNTPLKRLGQPLDIALAALYLASPASSYVTGKLLEVDGGCEAPNLGLGLPDL